MIEFHCAYCGKIKRTYRTHDAGKFCSKSCAAKYRYGHKRPDQQPATGTLWNKGCVFNPDGVHCVMKDCAKCGWNPEVAKARLEALVGV